MSDFGLLRLNMTAFIKQATVGNIVRLLKFPEPVAREINRIYPGNDMAAVRVIKLVNNGNTDIAPESIWAFLAQYLRIYSLQICRPIRLSL